MIITKETKHIILHTGNLKKELTIYDFFVMIVQIKLNLDEIWLLSLATTALHFSSVRLGCIKLARVMLFVFLCF